jgi:Fe-S cluster biogenesis protein NfuA
VAAGASSWEGEEVRHLHRVLRGHGGDLRVADPDGDGDLEVEFVGACRGCPALAFTYSAVVHPTLSSLEGVRSVRSRQVKLSPAIVARVRALGGGARDDERSRERR